MIPAPPPISNVLASLIVTVLLGFVLPFVMKIAKKSMPLTPPNGADPRQQAQWQELTRGNEGGAVLGWLERLMFFAAFAAGASIAVGAWLAFKVASKWQAWSTVIAVPKEIEGVAGPLDPFDLLIARRRWGSHVLMTFLIGTAYNILTGLIGAGVAVYWQEIVRLLSL